MMQKIVLTIWILICFATSIRAQSQDAALVGFQQSLDDFIQKRIKKHNVVGANVSIILEDEVVYDKGFGFSDQQNNIAADLNTTYPIGSVSKIVAATAVLKLYSDGIIDIDKAYTAYVPDFTMKKHFSGPINFTVRHLLAHHAGLPRLRAKGFLRKTPQALDSLLAFSKEEYLIAEAGKVYQYSDWGTDLLALLVQRMSNTSYESYVKEHIFKPLKMQHSGFGPVPTKGYDNGRETKTYEYSYAGSDGVYATTSDLVKLCQVYFMSSQKNEPSFLQVEIIKQALRLQFIDAPMAYDQQVGLMWDVRPLKGFKRVKKAGIHEPFFSYVYCIPEYNCAVAIASNSNSSSRLHWDIWNKTFDFLADRYELKGSQSLPKIDRNEQKTELTEQQLAELSGSYNTSIGLWHMTANNQKFDVRFGLKNRKAVAKPYGDNLLKVFVKMAGIKIPVMDVFWDKVNGEIIVGEQDEKGHRTIGGAKINNHDIPETWKNAIGTYEVVNYAANDYETISSAELFINENGILELNVQINYPNRTRLQVGIEPMSDRLAVIPGYNFDFFGGETVELIPMHNTTALKLSGYILKKINN